MERIWVTGSSGLIGSYILRVCPELIPQGLVIPLPRCRVDLTKEGEVRDAFEQDRPTAIIHCAAMSRSPACQADPQGAQRVNVQATKNLAQLASEIPFIHFSTDLVFDGKRGNYKEEDSPNPLGVYAETKLQAEQAVLANPKHTVLRTSLNAGRSATGDRSFVEDMELQWRQGRVLNLFKDEFRCPIPAEQTARAACLLLQQRATGIYHVAGAERLSRYQIGLLVAEMLGIPSTLIRGGTLMDYCGAPRAADTSLSSTKFETLANFALPRFSDWVRDQHEFTR